MNNPDVKAQQHLLKLN